jgi:hypothetical protein
MKHVRLFEMKAVWGFFWAKEQNPLKCPHGH